MQSSVILICSQVSAAVAGLVVGPLVWTPIGTRFGKAAVFFWSILLAMCSNIWSACMTKPDQYEVFVVSRLFAGLFGSAAITRRSRRYSTMMALTKLFP